MGKDKAKPPVEVEKHKPVGSYLREAGHLYLGDKFEREFILPLVVQIREYSLMPARLQPKEITLTINSPGGVAYWAWQLIDTMKQSAIPVVTVVSGLAASCGVLTLMAGHRRIATHNSSIMSHQYSWGQEGKEHELYAKLKAFEMTSEQMIAHYRKCTGKNEKYIRKHLLSDSDVWLSPAEAKRHGIIDEIRETY